MTDGSSLILLGGAATLAHRYFTGEWWWERFLAEKKGKLEVTGLSVPSFVSPGESFDAIATVTNVGDVEGTRTVRFKRDGRLVVSHDVTVPVGMERDVTATLTISEPGDHKVCAEVA